MILILDLILTLVILILQLLYTPEIKRRISRLILIVKLNMTLPSWVLTYRNGLQFWYTHWGEKRLILSFNSISSICSSFGKTLLVLISYNVRQLLNKVGNGNINSKLFLHLCLQIIIIIKWSLSFCFPWKSHETCRLNRVFLLEVALMYHATCSA